MFRREKRYIKIPEGCQMAAKDRSVWTDVFFFFQMKALNPEGSVHKSNLVSRVTELTGKSESSVWRKVRRLRDLGLIERDGSYYSLVKYDRLYKKLGYDLSLKLNISTNKKRRGRFKIFKIPVERVGDLIEEYQTMEIDLNLSRQRYNAKKGSDTEKTAQRHITRELLRAKHGEVHNPDVTLSCKGVSRLFGYQSTYSGFNKIKHLQREGRIEVELREEFIRTVSVLEPIPNQGSRYFVRNGLLLYRIPSLITVNN